MLNKSSNIIEKEFKNLRKELLDLTLRNQLLNFKSRAKTITIVNQSPINLFQTLVLQENKMYFVANKKDKKEDKSSVWDHIPFDFSKFSEGDKKLATDLTPKELQKRLYYINNQAKTMLQEQGYNILYLAIGFLEWKDKSKPRQKNNAPLVLIPVSMERKKVGESFNLEWTGEDIQTNISLKAKLLDAGIELPDFEFKRYGEVIDHYIASVRRAVSRMEGWKVNSNVALGFFSFTKFVMYNDLNPEAWADNVDLTKNELIQAIFNPAKNDQEAFREEDIDTQLEYQNMYQVLDADSSQIAAIQDVKAGRNLVVEGPPGTGKSQTIVNLIAELLAEGKSVLFVSEKMAALDVVKDRLTGVGLGKFVLELHSHKTRRKKFLKDLQKATNVRAQEPLNIDQTIRKLETLRRQLDDYSQIIHRPVFAVNLSAFQLYGMKESADDHFARKDTLMPLVRFESPESVTLKELDDMKIALENLAELYQTISKENPWSKCAPKSLLPADLREIEMLINDTLHSLDNFLVERGRVYDIYGIKKPDTLNEFQNSLSAFDIIKSQNAELIDGSIIRSGVWNNNNDDAFLLIQELQKYQRYAPALSKFNQSIFQADIDGLIYELRNISTKKFRFFNNKQHIDLVQRYYAVPVSGSIDEIIRDLQEAKAIIKVRKTLEANEALGQKYYGGYWHLNANPQDLMAIARWMTEFTALVRDGTFSQNTIELMSRDMFDFNPERDLAEYIESGEEFVSDLSKLREKLNPRSKLIFKRETGDVPFEAWQQQLYNWRGQLSSLHLWSQYLNTKNRLQSSNARMFVDSIEKRNIKKEDISALVEGNFADSLLNILFIENQELATFVGELHENRIREFKDLDKKILTLNRKRIFHKLNSNIPKIFGGTENPQAKILAGEFTRKSGHMPVRKLLEKAGGMIKQIKPCFMMSPLSIAQYLDPTNEELQFDVVIFDEASQVKPEDALGAFMRGKTAVVMGDTQQLPPTSFFDQMSDADSDEEEATSLDMESILHLCKLSFPVKMLKWHYRSRHESLITVSNREFYDDDLLVYPSPSHSDPELGLKFRYNPNTYYLRGASSKNPLEAKDVVDEIFNHFEKYGDTKSLGVGTFSVAQKNAILEELEIKRKEHPEYEPLFSDNKEERFFVKNLETIQGDERDVILISVGYGHDQDGKMSLNFGPLNQDGGERRLNVLITRAREKCVVFSNFKAYDMNLTANPPYGVKSLKEFLEYAENLTLGTHDAGEHTKEPFEDAIASFLEENGYMVDRQIGCAGFRVDLAIVDDENPGKYILGITTDGKMYSSSKVARDRDRLREQVLTGLGWKLYHLWSTDWYRNRDLGRKKLLEFVEDSIQQTREEERRRADEERKLAEKRRQEAERKAEELRIAREQEEKERAEKEAEEDEIDASQIGPEDFVEVEKADDGDFLEKPIDVSEINPSEFFEDDDFKEVPKKDTPVKKESIPKESKAASEFVVLEDEEVSEFEETPSEFIDGDSIEEDSTEFEDVKPSDVEEDIGIGSDDVKPSDVEEDIGIGSDDVKTVDVEEDIGIGSDDVKTVDVEEDIGIGSDDVKTVDVEEDIGIGSDDEGVIDDVEDLETPEISVEDNDSDSDLDDVADDVVDGSDSVLDDVEDDVDDSVGDETVDETVQETKVEFDKDLGDNDDILESESDSETQDEDFSDDKEVWEDENEPADMDDDAEVWEDSEQVSPEDNAEVWEDEHDYADDEEPKSIMDRIKSKLTHRGEDDDMHKGSIFAGLKFGKDVGDELDEVETPETDDIVEEVTKRTSQDENIDLGPEDDYIYVDHSNDESSDDYHDEEFSIEDYATVVEEEPDDEEIPDSADNNDSSVKRPRFGSKINLNYDDETEDGEADDEFYAGQNDLQSEVDDEFYATSGEEVKSSVDEIRFDSNDDEPEEVKSSVDEIRFDSNDDEPEDVKTVDNDDSASDEDIYVDHGDGEGQNDYRDDFDEPNHEISNESISGHGRSRRVNSIRSRISDVVGGEPKLEPEEIETVRGEVMPEDDVPLHKPAPKDDQVVEAEIVDGEETPLSRPDAKEDYYDEDEELNIFNDNLPDLSNDEYDEIHDEATRVIDKAMHDFMKGIFDDDEDEIIEDSEPEAFNENHGDDFERVRQPVEDSEPEAFNENHGDDFERVRQPVEDREFEVFNENHGDDFERVRQPVEDKQERHVHEEIPEPIEDIPAEDIPVPVRENAVEDIEFADEDGEHVKDDNEPAEVQDIADGTVYYQGANDVTNPLRKNNVYYKNEQKKSLKDSIKGIKKDMQYINKSLNEIENPTQIDYVSVVDRTEEYDPSEYLSRPSDDDSDRIIQMEEELTFAEKEEQRIEKELRRQALESKTAGDDNAVVTVNEHQRREELKDQALEDIIQSADENYKEIEKERFQQNNKLKSFDNHKLPGRKKIEDDIIDYVQAADFGLNSQNELYNQPIGNVAKSINEIVDIEGPIHVNEVTKRIKDSCKIKRAGSNLKKTVTRAIDEAENSGDIIRIGDFLYDASNNNVVVRKRDKPNIELISDEEIAKSIELVLLHKPNLTTKQIAKETSRNFGFRSTSKKTASRINGVLDLMIANNRVKIVNDYVELI